eukprot:TRINITY_DN91461_c0_g1_i1.p1 TRINITY_DN91461_c0_g1~~TRINITY_DN91461_c0_g1_i1.p1  ORF type:complete len:342 (+),score=34.82 TRINITY_DN91461_c0_g1_i1:72-1097(+)
MDPISSRYAVLAKRLLVGVLAHELLRKFQDDPDAFIAQLLPARLQHKMQTTLKPVGNTLVEVALSLVPLLQPAHLSRIQWETVAYGQSVAQQLDVLRPLAPNPPRPAPTIMFVHGGVWTFGRREHYRAVAQRLASEGFLVAVVGYATWPKADAQEQAKSVCSALEYAKTHALSWGGDPSDVYLMGHSSGAHVAAMTLMLGGQCKGFIGLGGVYDIEAHHKFERTRGVNHISMMYRAAQPWAENSPTLTAKEKSMGCEKVMLIHGDRDNVVPGSSSGRFACALLATGKSVEFVSLPYDDHASYLKQMALGTACAALEDVRRFCGLDCGDEDAAVGSQQRSRL